MDNKILFDGRNYDKNAVYKTVKEMSNEELLATYLMLDKYSKREQEKLLESCLEGAVTYHPENIVDNINVFERTTDTSPIYIDLPNGKYYRCEKTGDLYEEQQQMERIIHRLVSLKIEIKKRDIFDIDIF